VNIYQTKKIYFVDFSVHSIEEVLENTKYLKAQDAVVIRRYHDAYKEYILKIIIKCRAKRIKIFSHFKNNNPHDILHFASSFKNSIFNLKSISFHSIYDLKRLKILQPHFVFISPIFRTKTHTGAKPIGKIQAFVLAKMIKNLSPKTEIFLLGGMTSELFRKIKKLDYNNLFQGYAGIREVLPQAKSQDGLLDTMILM
jgi:hypothetical protein